MVNTTEMLSQKSLVVLLAYAPTGLGHLRVTDALFHGLPPSVTPLLLGSQDKSIGILHRVASIHPIGRKLMEWTQKGFTEVIFTSFYRYFLSTRTDILYSQLATILDQRLTLPKKVLVVSTHFGLAYELSLIKDKLMQEKNVQIMLVVVVTDDSPQSIWYIPHADLTLVPSHYTRNKLYEYAKFRNVLPIPIEVNPYPISPRLTADISELKFQERIGQTESSSNSTIHVVIPISGAAVGLNFSIDLMVKLHDQSPRFKFHVIVKNASYTQKFISTTLSYKYIQLHTSVSDRELVDMYESVYHTIPIAFEITKPSEQAFKSLLNTSQVGGSILLLTQPVGRQEYDNLDFLARHKLIPSISTAHMLWKEYKKDLNFTHEEKIHILDQAHYWRSLKIPENVHDAAMFLWWSLEQGIFTSMMRFTSYNKGSDLYIDEVSSHGVQLLWSKVSQYLAIKPHDSI